MLRATLRSCSRRSRVRISRSKEGIIHSSRFPSLHSSVTLPLTMRLILMVEYVPSSPLGGTPKNSPRWMHLVENLVTTMSPSATWYSKVKSATEKAARNSVTDLLYPSRLEPCPGSKLRSTKSGASTSSIVSRSPLTKPSSKRRARVLFFSGSDDTGASSSAGQPAFLYCIDTIHDATRRALAHCPEAYSPKLVDEGPRGSILLIPSTLSTPIRRGTGGPQKPFSSLSEGLRGIFIIITETGERLVSRTPHPRDRHVLVGSWCGSISFRPFPRNGCRNAWEVVVL